MNSLIQARNKYQITQQQAAEILGVSLRTYQRYESDFTSNNKKYINLLKILEDSLAITEEKGLLSISQIKDIVNPILDKYQINRCYLFGSYARREPRENSDVDLLIDTDITGLKFFSLVEELRTSLHKKVDVVRIKDLTANNELVINILREGVLIKQ